MVAEPIDAFGKAQEFADVPPELEETVSDSMSALLLDVIHCKKAG